MKKYFFAICICVMSTVVSLNAQAVYIEAGNYSGPEVHMVDCDSIAVTWSSDVEDPIIEVRYRLDSVWTTAKPARRSFRYTLTLPSKAYGGHQLEFVVVWGRKFRETSVSGALVLPELPRYGYRADARRHHPMW